MRYTMVDEPQVGTSSVPPVYGVTNPKLAVVRFHGRNVATWYKFAGDSRDRFDCEYSPAELAEWVPKLERAQRETDEVHVFFNTNKADQGPRNALWRPTRRCNGRGGRRPTGRTSSAWAF